MVIKATDKDDTRPKMKILLCLVYAIIGITSYQSFEEHFAHPLSVIEHMNEMKG